MEGTQLDILYEDTHILVCVKPHGLPTQSKKIGSPDMVSILKNHIKKQESTDGEPYLAVIHRLDQPVAGILVFAKTPFAAKELNKQLQNHGFGKYYRALVTGTLPKSEADLENYLVKDGKTNTSKVCSKNTPNAKLARLHYKIVKKGQGISQKGQGIFNWDRGISENTPTPIEPIELEIKLDTGRHHQIRVQLAHIGCPIIGDTKYNTNTTLSAGWSTLMLCAYSLSFKHPKTKKEMVFSLPFQE